MKTYFYENTTYSEDEIYELMVDCGADDDFFDWLDEHYDASQLITIMREHSAYYYNNLQTLIDDIYCEEYVPYFQSKIEDENDWNITIQEDDEEEDAD